MRFSATVGTLMLSVSSLAMAGNYSNDAIDSFFKFSGGGKTISVPGGNAANNSGFSREIMYEVTITNITKGIQFTPFLNATHARGVSLFEVGQPASQGIADMAEGGDISTLIEEVMAADASSMVADTRENGLLDPGQSVTVNINGMHFKHFSLAAMLLPTNDAFVALNAVELPIFHSRSVTYYADAYDAGTETNDELCANIPGPRCGGEPFSPDDEGEGYIYPSPGIHGEADLPQSTYNWQGPVAKVVITRLR